MEGKGIVLIVDDNIQSSQLAGDILEADGYRVLLAASGEEGLTAARESRPDVIVLDRIMPGMSGDEVAAQLKSDPTLTNIKILMLSAKDSPGDKAAGFELGADDYLGKPYDRNELRARVRVHLRTKKAEDALKLAYREVEQRVRERTAELTNANALLQSEIINKEKAETSLGEALREVGRLKNRLEEENTYLRGEIRSEHNFDEIIGQSEQSKKVLHQIEQVAQTDATVLILGESGTGKELIARAVHNNSRRGDRPLVKLNCATLPANLVESELFGHEKGAFTGATARKAGRFELADGGTIFLDEIGELPLELQSKLLRVLQEGEFERVGGNRTEKTDVRVIAATNRDLEQAMAQGAFRKDLFYRLNVFPIVSPPLRNRREDIPALAEHFIQKHAPRIGKPIKPLSKKGLAAMAAYDWPGNIRELENFIERALIVSAGAQLRVEDLLEFNPPSRGGDLSASTLQEVERNAILAALEETNWVIEGKHGAALKLGLEPSTLRSRMKKHKITKPA